MTAVAAISHEASMASVARTRQFGRFTTKLSAPRLRLNLVARQQLVQRIGEADAPVTVVCAPAGYGKSTLVTQWLASAGIPGAWVSLDPYDNDPLDFFSLIVGSIQSIDQEIGATSTQLLHNTSAPASQALAKSLLDDIYATTRPFALVLDDYQSIENVEIHAAMSRILHNLPPTLRVFLITRVEPPIQLARLRSRQELFELGHEDLRFTNGEALELLQRSDGLELTPGDVSSINDRAEGWVAGLQLVCHVLRGHSPARARQFTAEFSGSVRSIESYLWEEVILEQPEEIQLFLKRTSILTRFSAPLCDVVTGRDDSAVLIRQLEQDRLFLIALDDVGHWYRYHHLFADVLRDRLALETSEADLAKFHRNAAAWFEDQDLTEEAARHAFAGRDWERSARLLERIGSDLYNQDRIPTLHRWLQGLPKETLEQSPRLAYLLAFARIRLGLVRQAEEPMQILERAWNPKDQPSDFGAFRILQGFLALRTDVLLGIGLIQEGIDLLPEEMHHEKCFGYLVLGHGYITSGKCAEAERAFSSARLKADEARHSWLKLAEMGGSSSVLLQQGKLKEAAVLLRRIVKLGDETHAIPIQLAHMKLGEIYLQWNLPLDAERHLDHADRLCEETQSFLWRCEICVDLARLAWARGEFETGFDEIERAVAIANGATLRNHTRFARAHQARFWVATGNLALARLWAESAELGPDDPSDYFRYDEIITLALVHIAEQRFDIAHDLLDALATSARANGRNGNLVEIYMLLAMTYRGEGNHAEALEVIDRALTIGNQGGYIRIFVDKGEAIAPLLRHSSTRGANRDYVQRLLTAIDGSAASISQVSIDMIEPLSEREIEVLRLVSAGLPNRTIGDHLFITEKTVKKHLSNILGKLGATNRTQASDQARRLGLI
jgi:LuxR family transcriptional regulator, maltose regulon positive regulatory protein